MNAGWIMLHRKLLDNAIARRPAYCHLWVHLLLRANHKETSFIWNGRTQTLRPGQLLTGRKQLSSATGIPETTIERILDFLEGEHQIERQSTTKFRIISIVNWHLYQNPCEGGHQPDNKRTTDGHQTDTYKNEKNEKNEDKVYINADALRLAGLLFDLIRQRKGDFRPPELHAAAGPIARMLDRDGRSPDRIEAVIRRCQADPFWQNIILSTRMLRKHFDALELQTQRDGPGESVAAMVARMEREGLLQREDTP